MTTSPVMGITEEILGEIERAGWKLVPVEPTPEMIAALGFNGDVDLAIGHAAISWMWRIFTVLRSPPPLLRGGAE